MTVDTLLKRIRIKKPAYNILLSIVLVVASTFLFLMDFAYEGGNPIPRSIMNVMYVFLLFAYIYVHTCLTLNIKYEFEKTTAEKIVFIIYYVIQTLISFNYFMGTFIFIFAWL